MTPIRATGQKVHKCPGCPLLFRDHKSRIYCTDKCRIQHKRRQQQERLDEFLWIADTDSYDNIARRLGFGNRESLVRWLNRLGEHEWAARVHSTGMPRVYHRLAA